MTSFFKSLLILIPLLILTTAFTNKHNIANNQPINKVFNEKVNNKINIDSPFQIINDDSKPKIHKVKKKVKQHKKEPEPKINRKPQDYEELAKQEIADAESSNSYTAVNGRYYGKYQLDISYLHGDLSPENQERVFEQYCKERYGSIQNALAFRQIHNWY